MEISTDTAVHNETEYLGYSLPALKQILFDEPLMKVALHSIINLKPWALITILRYREQENELGRGL